MKGRSPSCTPCFEFSSLFSTNWTLLGASALSTQKGFQRRLLWLGFLEYWDFFCLSEASRWSPRYKSANTGLVSQTRYLSASQWNWKFRPLLSEPSRVLCFSSVFCWFLPSYRFFRFRSNRKPEQWSCSPEAPAKLIFLPFLCKLLVGKTFHRKSGRKWRCAWSTCYPWTISSFGRGDKNIQLSRFLCFC